jgi:hypothetical protein
VTPEFAQYTLLDALRFRRSRRFCLGMDLPDGPLKYRSRYNPVPLTEREEALLAFAACGITGPAVADLAYNHDAGGNIMAGLVGRTISSGDGIQAVSLFVINDDGVWYYRRPQDLPAREISKLIQLSEWGAFEEAALKTRIQLSDKRAAPPVQPIFNINANRWSAHSKGTSYFLPVNELTMMYINGLLEILNEHTGVFPLDERAGFKPAGVERFAKSKGGHLRDDPAEGRVATVSVIERFVTEFVTIEQGMMLQNIGLMAQALGLGSFPNFANHDFGWFEALGFQMQRVPISQYLGMKTLPALGLKLLGKDTLLPIPIGLEAGDFKLKSYAPPYYVNMRVAVEAVVEYKCGAKGVFRSPDSPCPWKSPATASKIQEPSKKAIDATVAYCEYIWDRYGRFPAYMAPFRTVLGAQVGHLDLEFYDNFYRPEVISKPQQTDFEAVSKTVRV